MCYLWHGFILYSFNSWNNFLVLKMLVVPIYISLYIKIIPIATNTRVSELYIFNFLFSTFQSKQLDAFLEKDYIDSNLFIYFTNFLFYIKFCILFSYLRVGCQNIGNLVFQNIKKSLYLSILGDNSFILQLPILYRG